MGRKRSTGSGRRRDGIFGDMDKKQYVCKTIMKTEEFLALVTSMRHWQKEYFAGRSPVALAESRRLERAVDRAIEEMQQLKLWN